jgi:hypothetical protein
LDASEGFVRRSIADSPTVAAHTASAFATAISATTETVSA